MSDRGLGRLDGRVAIVTGAARGMGAATAALFAREGARVVLVDRRDDLGSASASAIDESVGAPVTRYVSADVTSAAAWDEIVGTAITAFGPPAVLVNNAGILRVQSILDTDLETFQRIVDTNLTSCFLGMRAAVPAMAAHGGGSVINVSSPQGFEGRSGFGAYTASKFAVRGLTRTAAIEFGPLGVRVNCVVPGPIRTAMTERKGWDDDDYARAYGGYPLGRRGEPDEVAKVSLFLASDDSSYCTGGDFVADGGVLAGKPVER
jgi:3alpha(or 20beta)-hydroxysteroid dehydrogenase